MNGFFKNLGAVELNSKDAFFEQGRYLVEIKDVVVIDTNAGGQVMKIQGQVLGVQSEHVDAPKVGQLASEVYKMSGDTIKYEIARRRWKGFINGVMGWTPETPGLTDQHYEQASTAIINGEADHSILVLETFNRPNKNGNGVHTVHNWLRRATKEDFDFFGVQTQG